MISTMGCLVKQIAKTLMKASCKWCSRSCFEFIPISEIELRRNGVNNINAKVNNVTACYPLGWHTGHFNVIRGGRNDPQLPKTWEVFVSRHFWVHFCPRYRGSQWILVSRGFRICMTKGGRESKMPGYGNFQSVPRYRKGTDQKPPITRHYMRIHQDPLYMG